MVFRLAAAMAACPLFTFLPAIASAQSFNFTKIADSTTTRPDQTGLFLFPPGAGPSIDNGLVVFVSTRSAFPAVDAIWTANLDGTNVTPIVSAGQPAPGGIGVFTAFTPSISYPVAKNGTVVFGSIDQNQDPLAGAHGIYTAPTAGGAPSLIANYATTSPSGGVFANTYPLINPTYGQLSTDGVHVSFYGMSKKALNPSGIYAATVNGARLVKIADINNLLNPAGPGSCPFAFLPINNFAHAVVTGGSVIFAGTKADTYPGSYEAIYQTDFNGIPANLPVCPGFKYSAFNPVVDSNTKLPMDTRSTPANNFTGAFSADGSQVAFGAKDDKNFSGIFVMNLDGSGLTEVASTADQLPGLTTQPFLFNSFSLNNGSVAFTAFDSASPANTGLYLYQNGLVSKVIGSGDMLGTAVVSGFYPDGLQLGPASLSMGVIAFNARFADGSAGVYVAAPPSN